MDKFLENTQVIVRAVGLSKKYALYSSPGDRLREIFNPFRKKFHKDFWAVNNASFSLEKGKTYGIVGPNGSGKSTLLQLIAGILMPTAGEIQTFGKVSALLELGAAFNPEFTGRHNSVLNGIVMGLSEAEAKDHLPEIEMFANIGEFFDLPVRMYSSGMFLRLAFSVLVSMDPDILMIDEALAVGDARFQRKCYDKLHEFKDAGKTLIFVSHDMEAMVRLCDEAFLMSKGSIVSSGEPKMIRDLYRELTYTGKITFSESGGHSEDVSGEGQEVDACDLQDGKEEALFSSFVSGHLDCDNFPERPSYNSGEQVFGSGRSLLWDYCLLVDGHQAPSTIPYGTTLLVYVRIKTVHELNDPECGMVLRSKNGQMVYGVNNEMDQSAFEMIDTADGIVFGFSLKILLQEGDYFLDLGLSEKVFGNNEMSHFRGAAIHIAVGSGPPFDGIVDLQDASFKAGQTN